MNGLTILLFGIALFRITHLLVFDKITTFIRAPFMQKETIIENGKPIEYQVPRKNGIRGFIGEIFACYWCMGVWVAMGLLLMHRFYPTINFYLVIAFAIAGIGAFIETIIQKLSK